MAANLALTAKFTILDLRPPKLTRGRAVLGEEEIPRLQVPVKDVPPRFGSLVLAHEVFIKLQKWVL